jgi:hypothetical protein
MTYIVYLYCKNVCLGWLLRVLKFLKVAPDGVSRGMSPDGTHQSPQLIEVLLNGILRDFMGSMGFYGGLVGFTLW